MPLVLANRVQETGTANTTVSFTLTGAVTGFQSFAVIGNTNTTYYSATDGAGNWEVGLGTYSTTGPTLTRTTVYASSNSGSPVTFSGAVNVFVTYPSGRSVNLNESGNVSALGTVSSGVWQGSTVGVAYGGTGVTASSGANSVVLRDANQNITVNRVSQANTSTTAAGGTTALTAASSYIHTLVGTGGQTYTMPDATTLTTGVAFVFNNMATGTLTLQDYAAGAIGTIPNGGAGAVFLTDNSTTGGTWDIHAYLPEGVTFGTNAFNLGSSVVSGGTWQGGTIQPAYGGTGLTTFTGANRALYSTGATTLTAGTLPVVAGGTGVTTTPANGQLLIGNGSSYTVASLGTGTGISTTTGAGTLTINNTGVTSLAGTSPVSASASTGAVTVSLASGYGDTQNPYASKTANFFLAAPNGSAGAPTFRAIVAADIPTLNQNTTGSAGSVANAVTFNNGGAGDVSGTTFNGSAARTISYNTIGAPSTTGTNATGTWAINISGNAATATSATDSTKLPLSGGTMTGTISFNTAFNVQMWRHGSNGPGARSDGTYLVLARGSGGGGDQQFYIDGFSNILKDGNIVLHAGNYNSYAPTLTGGGASGTWGISISGNAATATSATTADQIDSWPFRNTGSNSGTAADSLDSNGITYVSSNISLFGQTDGALYSQAYSSSWQHQIFGDYRTGQIAIRGKNNGTWQSWRAVLDATNYNSYAPTLTGTGASGTWGISISGNSNTTNYVNNVGYGNGNFSWYQSSGNWQTWTGGWASHLISNHGDGSTYYNQTIIMPFWGPPQYMRKEGGTNVGPYVFLTTENYTSYSPSLTGTGASGTWGINISGNAATATTASSASSVAWGNVSSKPSNIMYYQGFTLDANTMDSNATGFTYANNAPYTGPVARFSTGGGYDLWLNAPYGGGNNIAFRTRNGDTATLNSWRYPVIYDINGASGALYGTIFYDQNDTGYYLNPNGTSQLSYVLANNWFRPQGNTGLFFESYGWGLWAPEAAGNSYGNVATYGGGRNGWAGYAIGSRHVFMSTGGDNVGVHDNSRGWIWYWNGSYTELAYGYSVFGGSARAPIFYDSNDTNYYCDPNGTSVLNAINTWGEIGPRRSDTQSLLRSYNTSAGSPLQFYLDHNFGNVNIGNNRGVVFAGGSYWEIANSVRAPIFYDSNNTAYYTDPASTSQLNVLVCAGNITSSGTIAASSDERLKTNWRDLPANFVELLAKVKSGVYDRIDQENLTQVGVSAQSLLPVLPNAVTHNADGMLGVAYGNAALVSAVKLAEKVLLLEQRIKQLEGIA